MQRFSRRVAEQRMDEEIRFHIEMETEKNIRAGMAPEEARRRAILAFGGVEKHKEVMREGWRITILEDCYRDIEFALRVLGKHRAFASAAILTLAVGIGTATAMFSIADGVLLRSLPIREQGRVVVAWAQDPAAGSDHVPLPFAAFPALGSQTRVFTDVAALDYNGALPRPARIGGEATNLNGAFVTGNLFRVLGVEAQIGRGLQPDDDRVGAEPVVVISDGLWRRRFGSDPNVLGTTLGLNGQEATIVGVMPRGFEYPANADVWATTLPFTAGIGTDQSPQIFIHLIGRLAPGATIQQAQSELTTFLQSDDALLPPPWRVMAGVAQSLEDHLLGAVRPLVWALLSAVGLLLLITVANVATLLMGRAVERWHEFAVRGSLGAGAGRIRVQVTTESLVLALIGGLLGVALAYGVVHLFVGLAPPDLPRSDAVGIDARTLLFSLAVCAGAALVFGFAPAGWLARTDLSARLRTGGRGGTGLRTARLAQRYLVIAQVTLALVVVAGAGLILRSLHNLERLDWGVAKEHVLLAQFSPPEWSAYLDHENYRTRVDELADAIGALPGVASAVPTLMPPFGGASGWDAKFRFEGQSSDDEVSNPWLNLEIASPDYFRTLGIPLLRGRGISEQDGEDGPLVAVISDSVARFTWPGEDPIGQRMRFAGEGEPWRTVVGVVGDTRYRDLTRIRPTVYLPRTQYQANPVYIAVRTEVEPRDVIAGIRRVGDDVWPGMSFPLIQPLADYASEPLARPRFAAALFSAFSLTSLLLASIGLYGVMGGLVLQRTREFGIRTALGADGRQILKPVMRQGMLLVLAGVAIGTAVALVLTRLLSSVLYGVSPTDPPSFVAAMVLLLGVGLLASYLPARRATRVDPMVALRTE